MIILCRRSYIVNDGREIKFTRNKIYNMTKESQGGVEAFIAKDENGNEVVFNNKDLRKHFTVNMEDTLRNLDNLY